MWTWTTLAVLAIIVQASYGIRTFPQDQIPWRENEVIGHRFGKNTNEPVDDLHLDDFLKQVITTQEKEESGLSPAPTPSTPNLILKSGTTADLFNGEGEDNFLEDLFSPFSAKEHPSQFLNRDMEHKNIIKIRRLSPIYRKKLLTIKIKKDPTPVDSLPLPFLDAGANRGDLERVIEEAGRMMDALSSTDQKDEGRPKSIFKSINEENNSEINNKNIFEMLTRLMKKTPTSNSEEEAPSCGSPVDENEDRSARKTIMRIRILPRDQDPRRNTQTLRGSMLKPLIPRHFFLIKDLSDNMKSLSTFKNNDEEERDRFQSTPFQNPRTDGRFAFSPIILNRIPSSPPPMRFPATEPQPKLSQGSDDLDFDRVIKSLFSPKESNDQFKDFLRRSQNRDVKTESELHNFQNDYQEEGDSGSDLDAFVNSILPLLASKMPLELRNSLIPAIGKMAVTGKLDLKEDIPIHYRQQLLKMTLGK